MKYNYGVGLIFFANLFCTFIVSFGFIKEIKGIFYGFDRQLARRMLSYALPLLLLGLVGILNQVFDKIAFKHILDDKEYAQVQLGIYGACCKIAMILALLTQAFRYAYEPLVFGGSKDKNSSETLAMGMKFFIIFGLLAYLAVMFYLPILKYLITNRNYWSGLGVVPIVMMAELFMGIYFNLSFWYKLKDNTWWGALMSGIGAVVMISINILFVPQVRLYGLSLGRVCRLWNLYAAILFYRAEKESGQLSAQGDRGLYSPGRPAIYCLFDLPASADMAQPDN